jgi:serine/threonine protein kinase
MGLVYKAEDLKLGRRVALKFLPEDLVTDSISRQRFEREARTASSLNHPNICTIYEVDEHEGQPFIVMELLEGKTLRERLSASSPKPLAPGDVVSIATQICGGLQAAHEKGIVHRDIKPANIFLNAQEQVKILDFGLAKFTVAAVSPAEIDIELRPTHHAPADLAIGRVQAAAIDQTLTDVGSAMGTAGYMSPEQIRGEKLDARTDLFSLGLVLYEMVTGLRAFSGETAAVVRDAILNSAPIPLTGLNSRLPAKLITTIDKCLEKDREQRYQSAAAVRTSLQQVRDPENKRTKFSRAAWVVVLILVALAIGVYLRRAFSDARSRMSPSSLEVIPLTESGKAFRAAATPDAHYIAYVKREGSNYELRLLQVASGRDVQLLPSSPQPIRSLHFSPDGNFLYFLRVLNSATDPDTSGVFRIATLGGPVTTLATDARTGDARMGSVAVSPDGKQVAYISNTARESLIVAVDPDGANRHILATRPLSMTFDFVEWSRSQNTLAAVAVGKDDMGLVTIDLPTGSIKDLSVAGWGAIGPPAWSPDGATVFAPAIPLGSWIIQIWAFDPRTGDHRALTSSSTPFSQWSLSSTAAGDLIANTRATDTTLWVANSFGQPRAVPAIPGEGSLDVVWVGNRIVTSRLPASEMMVHEPDGGNPTKLRSYSRIYRQLARCGSAHVIYWAVDPKRGQHVARTEITTGSSSAVTDGPLDDQPTCTPDGSAVIFVHCVHRVKPCFIRRRSLDSGQSLDLYELGADDGMGLTSPTLSSDGTAVLFRNLSAGDPYVWATIVPIAGGDPKTFRMPVPSGEVIAFRWAADGKSILYARNENGVGNIWSAPLSGKAPSMITSFDSDRIFAFDISPDNQLVISRGHEVSDAVLIKNVKQ